MTQSPPNLGIQLIKRLNLRTRVGRLKLVCRYKPLQETLEMSSVLFLESKLNCLLHNFPSNLRAPGAQAVPILGFSVEADYRVDAIVLNRQNQLCSRADCTWWLATTLTLPKMMQLSDRSARGSRRDSCRVAATKMTATLLRNERSCMIASWAGVLFALTHLAPVEIRKSCRGIESVAELYFCDYGVG